MRVFYIATIILSLSAVQVKSQARLAVSRDPDTIAIKFYPNPAVSLITFDFQKEYNKSYSFQIFNFLGKKVYEAPAIDQKTMVNLSDFFRGIYIFQLRDQYGKIIQSGKFQVVK
jgi:hypothetical protein